MSQQKIITLDNMSLQEIDHEAELIPLLTPEDEEEMNKESLPVDLPILPLRNTVLFPGVVIPITAGRDKSIKLLNDANSLDKIIGVVSQKNEEDEDPTEDQINKVGTVARILKILKMPDGNITVILQGKKRFEIDAVTTTEPYIRATIKEVPEIRPVQTDDELNAIIDSIRELAIQIIKESPNIPTEATFAIKNIESDPFLVSFVSSNMNLTAEEKQKLLEIDGLKERALETLKHMNIELQKLELKNDIQSKVRFDLDQQQREYFLQQQMKTIQEELGGNSTEQEIEEMRKKAKVKKWKKKVGEHFEKELQKLQRTNPNSPDFSIQRNYLELFLELPWNEYTKDKFDLKRAQTILDRDHYGMEEIKKRIIEHLAVLKLRNDMKSPILCFTGPPGVGKTSIGRSIAEALGREYVRMSLGGLRDEAEIRGHRKTYIGAMPGRILQNLKKVKSSNPVFILDEIDKLSSSHSGDPSSALLEALDPEQNKEFYDNFLEMGFDLSKIMFIATSNNISAVQPALRDRMEIITMTGYTVEEKIEIAKQHLVPKQIKDHGLNTKQFSIGKKQIEKIVEGYTRESGVRGLEKKIAQMVRNAAKSVAMEEEYNIKATDEDVVKVLGAPRMERDKYENNETAGVVTGLAWTSVGGDILFIESIISAGKGGLTFTGNIGTVMKESITIAMEYVKANTSSLGIDTEIFTKYNIHVHIPEGATPKDGPSAGIAMLTSLVSLLTQKRVKKQLAMTGEITLRGKVLPVGGIKEKILAAKRAKIKEIILCVENKRDIDEINPDYLEGLTFHYVSEMSEVLEIAITKEKVKNPKTL
ncbi:MULTISPECIES: endopeptidase La [Flavobacterium]|uniref:Lon protease n=1 Tax=Flavobacterium columnare TaxID=996 RepID=A0AA94F2A8_9FLAO|nr:MULTISPECIES: endopeptidase La [Flavobacterium]MCH4828535.1 endopeptidase La [Flavobacterium columnare]MCH4831788.1 endopeptidase La [Flavobacterium columnare]OWP86527.1 endopeptidase La [Flavobacterium covae]